MALTAGAAYLNPSAGIAVGGGLIGGTIGSKVGDQLSGDGLDLGKITGPLGALTLPLLLLMLAKQAGVDVATLCDLIEQACNVFGSMKTEALVALLGGTIAITTHDLTRSTRRDK